MGNPPLIKDNFKQKSLLSVDQLDKSSILNLFKKVPLQKRSVEKNEIRNDLKGKIISLLFFEPSSRTFSSFAAAVKRLGGQTLEFQNLTETSSVKKGESLEDTIKTFSVYSNGIIIRHPQAFSAYNASQVCNIPVINAGDGTNEHPTQMLLDLYTIYEKFNKLNNLKGVLVGDLLNGRTVHSLLKGLSKFKGNTVYLLSPKQLSFPLEKFSTELKNTQIIKIRDESEIPEDANFWYWTRVQKERFKNLREYEKLKNSFILSNELLSKKGNKNLILMHPLPRIEEIESEVDQDKRAMYFRNQIRNGLYVRMALLSLIFKK